MGRTVVNAVRTQDGYAVVFIIVADKRDVLVWDDDPAYEILIEVDHRVIFLDGCAKNNMSQLDWTGWLDFVDFRGRHGGLAVLLNDWNIRPL